MLPTGYGKTSDFMQLLVLVGKEERRRPVICPLKSIIDHQIGEAEGLGIRAVTINDVSSDYLRSSKFQLFESAESVLEKRVLHVLYLKDGVYFFRGGNPDHCVSKNEVDLFSH